MATTAALVLALLGVGRPGQVHGAERGPKPSQTGPGYFLGRAIVRLALAGQLPGLVPRHHHGGLIKNAWLRRQDRLLAESIIRWSLERDNVHPEALHDQFVRLLLGGRPPQGHAPELSFTLLPNALRGLAASPGIRRKKKAVGVLQDLAALTALYAYSELSPPPSEFEQLVRGRLQNKKLEYLYDNPTFAQTLLSYEPLAWAGHALSQAGQAAYEGQRLPRVELQRTLKASGADESRLGDVLDALYAAPIGRAAPGEVNQWLGRHQLLSKVADPVRREVWGNLANRLEHPVVWPWTRIADTQFRQGVLNSANPEAQQAHHSVVRYNYLLNSPEHDIRVGTTTIEELRGNFEGQQIEQELIDGMRRYVMVETRSSGDWKAVKQKLKALNVGGAKGQRDRWIVADAFMAMRFAAHPPRFITQDKGVTKLVAEALGWGPKGGGHRVDEIVPQGAVATLAHKSLLVEPIAVPSKTMQTQGRPVDFFTELAQKVRAAADGDPEMQFRADRIADKGSVEHAITAAQAGVIVPVQPQADPARMRTP